MPSLVSLGGLPVVSGRRILTFFSSRVEPPTWLCWFLLAGWSAVLFFYGMTSAELWRTESLRAIIAQDMLRTGNWIVPKLYGEPLFTKPPGLYLAIVLCSLPLGKVTEITARLPSALAATIAVFLFYGLFTRYLGRRAGLLAAIMLPMSLIFLDKAPAAEIDMLQVVWVMAALLCFLRVLEREEDQDTHERTLPTREIAWWLAAFVCVAGGVLTKWTAPAFFYATVIPLLWARGRMRLFWSLSHGLAAALGGGICLAWIGAAVYLEGWHVFAATVLQEALPRLVPLYDQEYHAHHSYFVEVIRHPFWILGATLPWSIVALWSLKPGFYRLWNEREQRLLVFLHCWTWPNLIFWTLMSDHTPRHSFPCFPGIAGLAALVWWGWFTGKLPLPWPRIRPDRAIVCFLIAWLGAKAILVEAIMPRRMLGRDPRAKGELLASLVPAERILYLFGLKDEGIMFYFGRPVVRLKCIADLPSSPEPVYCILNYSEWEEWRGRCRMHVLEKLTDEQGDPIVLVRVR
jgi:4-amino-4-deoxy-L-arabinose transferase-like glycosyltransferase